MEMDAKGLLPSFLLNFINAAKTQDFDKGDIVQRIGEDVSFFGLILSGQLRRIASGDNIEDMPPSFQDGRDVLMEHLARGDIIGESLVMLSAQDAINHDCMVSTQTPVKIAVMGRHNLRRFQDSNPDDYEELRLLSCYMTLFRLKQTRNIVTQVVNLNSNERVRVAINRAARSALAMPHDNGVEIRITRHEIGAMAGCSREVAGRVVNALQEAGHLEMYGKTLVVYGGHIDEVF